MITGSLEEMKKYNSLIEDLIILEEVDEDTKIVLMKFKGMLLVSGREFLVIVRRYTLEGGYQAYITYSIDDYENAPPETSKFIRAQMKIGGWYFKPLKPEGDGETDDWKSKTIAMNFAINDLKGNLPKFVIKASAISQTQILYAFR